MELVGLMGHMGLIVFTQHSNNTFIYHRIHIYIEELRTSETKKNGKRRTKN